ncbi:MAG: pitrilysin family protein [Candidatus Babeliales bacterium]
MNIVKKVFALGAIIVCCYALSGMKYIRAFRGRKTDKIRRHKERSKNMSHNNDRVIRIDFENGLTVLIKKQSSIPYVSLQMWFKVGSKDERDDERGLAHLLEHMIFKGTEGEGSLNLSESDINVLVHSLSGGCNAFTSYDYTGYLFNMPSQHYEKLLAVMADCMRNASLCSDHLDSEMVAVIQELKMYRDNYVSSLKQKMMAAIFAGHPYMHPIIGYKRDLFDISSNELKAFAHEYYVPNNSVIVVVGDVDPDLVIEQVKSLFGSIPADLKLSHKASYYAPDVAHVDTVLYRDVQHSFSMVAYNIPGLSHRDDYVMQLLVWILARGKGSRLYKRLVDELQLATSVTAYTLDLFDHDLFFIMFEPKNEGDHERIMYEISCELQNVATGDLSDQEIIRASKKMRMDVYRSQEDMESLAYTIGRDFLATGNENAFYTFLQDVPVNVDKNIKELCARYLRPCVGHVGRVLPLPENEKKTWLALQKKEDAYDHSFLQHRTRVSPVEPPRYALKIVPESPQNFNFPEPAISWLSNGVKVLISQNSTLPKINVVLNLKAQRYYDSDDKPGLYNIVAKLLTEGTLKHPGTTFSEALEARGITMQVGLGALSMEMLTEDFEYGMQLLLEALEQAELSTQALEKIRSKSLIELKHFWDSPTQICGQLMREHMYKGHPYSKNILGTEDSIKAIAQADVRNFYQQMLTADGAVIALVGDMGKWDVHQVLEKTLSHWRATPVQSIVFPCIPSATPTVIDYAMNRDQVVIQFAAPSIDRLHKDYDALWIFDQIFGGGILGSLSSKLFQLREQSGLFYSVYGSLLDGSSEQPGMVTVKTMVSCDRLQSAEKEIRSLADTVLDTVTEEEFIQAKNALLNGLRLYFESNSAIAQSFLFVDKYHLPLNYFSVRSQVLSHITLSDMKDAVKRLLRSDLFTVVRVGRLPESKKKDSIASQEADR